MSDWDQNGTTVLDEHGHRDETADIGPRVATTTPAEDHDATPAARRARSPRTRRRNTGHVPDDLPTVLHRHLAAMGPAEALQALNALQRLTLEPSTVDGRVAPVWLALLGTQIGQLRDAPAIKRLVAMLVDLVPVIGAADNDAAVDAVIGFARAQTTAAAETAADRQRRRR